MDRREERDDYCRSPKVGQASRERAGVLNVHPHRFRRTAATLARRHGMPIELVSRFLGHENIETTMAYSMINDDEVKISHQKFVS